MKLVLGLFCTLFIVGCITSSEQKQNWDNGGTATSAPANLSHWTAEEYDAVLECVAINRKIVLQECGEFGAATYSAKLSDEIYIMDYDDAVNHVINMRKHMVAFHSK
ncbi:hypothetical protein P4C99_10235 [Pontiellaceae bacterium B1224]|nr:hypothetical protein [Pontiellaceae bacterium B1224]